MELTDQPTYCGEVVGRGGLGGGRFERVNVPLRAKGRHHGCTYVHCIYMCVRQYACAVKYYHTKVILAPQSHDHTAFLPP